MNGTVYIPSTDGRDHQAITEAADLDALRPPDQFLGFYLDFDYMPVFQRAQRSPPASCWLLEFDLDPAIFLTARLADNSFGSRGYPATNPVDGQDPRANKVGISSA